jgi:hypothetical protein
MKQLIRVRLGLRRTTHGQESDCHRLMIARL